MLRVFRRNRAAEVGFEFGKVRQSRARNARGVFVLGNLLWHFDTHHHTYSDFLYTQTAKRRQANKQRYVFK